MRTYLRFSTAGTEPIVTRPRFSYFLPVSVGTYLTKSGLVNTYLQASVSGKNLSREQRSEAERGDGIFGGEPELKRRLEEQHKTDEVFGKSIKKKTYHPSSSSHTSEKDRDRDNRPSNKNKSKLGFCLVCLLTLMS